MKKKAILAALMTAMLLGCGNQEKQNEAARVDLGKLNEINADTDVKEDTGALGNSDKEVSTDVEADTNTEKIDVEANQDTEASQNIDEDSAQDRDVFVFGDKATMNHMVGERELPIYCVDTEEKKVALSFDAAWGNEDTQAILDILDKHDINVTFFMTGGWVESYPEDVKKILAAGHDLGNHSENHKNMSQLSEEEKTEELMSVHRKVKEITGYDMFLFRPPYGDYDNAVIETVKNCKYYPIQWDVDSLDWQNKGVDNIIKTVTEHKNLGDGSIILCHNGSEYIVEALDELIASLEGQGYQIVPISQLIYKENYHLNYEGRQIQN